MVRLTIPPASYARLKLHPAWQALWGRFDTSWFIRVATQGYAHGLMGNAAFFPLDPGLIRLGMIIDPHLPTIVVPLFVAWAASFFVFYWLAKLVGLDHDQRRASRVLKTMALYPMAFFLTVAYSEAPFIALVVGTFYTARRGQWIWSGVLGFLAALTRNEGVILFFPLLWEYVQQFHWRVRWQVVGFLGAPIGLLLYMAYLQSIGRGAFAMLKAERIGWHRKNGPAVAGNPFGTIRAAPSSHEFASLCVHHYRLDQRLSIVGCDRLDD